MLGTFGSMTVGRTASLEPSRPGVEVTVASRLRAGSMYRAQPIENDLGSRAAPESFDVLFCNVHGTLRELRDADVVAERIPQCAVDAVRLLGRHLREFDTLGAERFVRFLTIVGVEHGRGTERTLRDQVPDLCRDLLAVRGRTGQLEQQLSARVGRQLHGEPPHETHVDVVGDLETELAAVEV